MPQKAFVTLLGPHRILEQLLFNMSKLWVAGAMLRPSPSFCRISEKRECDVRVSK